MAVEDSEQLVDAFIEKRELYQAFARSVSGVVQDLLRSEDIDHIPVEARTKTVESFRGKVTREGKEGKYSNIQDVTDLVGVRIIVYNKFDIDRARNLVTDNFTVDSKNSTDKTANLEPDRFGYLSVHYVVQYDEKRRILPENKKFDSLKAEIQIRTVVQHAWASIDRKLRYNQEEDIPGEVRRRLYRISALLEMADEEFSAVSETIIKIKKQYETKVSDGNLDIEINKDSLIAFLKESKIVHRLLEIASTNGIYILQPKDAAIDSILRVCDSIGIKTIDNLATIIREERIQNQIDRYYKSRKKDVKQIGTTSATIVRAAIFLGISAEKRAVFKQIFSDNQIKTLINVSKD